MEFSIGNLRQPVSIGLVLFVALAASCATKTLVESRWISPQYKGGGMHKLLVIGVAETDLGRRTYEDGFAEALQNVGAEAVPSYQGLPTTDQIDRAKLEAFVRANDFDGVMVTRLLDGTTTLSSVLGA